MLKNLCRALSNLILWLGLGLIGLLAIPTAVLVGGITLVWSGADKLSKLLDKDAF